MKIVMLCGGRGATTIIESVVRQTDCEIALVINCYDNGLSTGRIRKQIDGLLGPSDFRKNLTTFLSVLGQNHLANFLEFRIANLQDSGKSLTEKLSNLYKLDLQLVNAKQWKIISESLSHFEQHNERATIKFDYKDCAIGNLVVAGCYLKNQKNLNQALASLCMEILGEQSKYTILNVTDGANLFLFAQSREEKWIFSEEEIVDNPENLRISDVYLSESPIQKIEQAVNQLIRVTPNPNPEVLRTIISADVIIYGPGTPASSLYPSYLTRGIPEAIEINQNAIKLFISNINPDRDDPKGTLKTRIDGTISHMNRNSTHQFENLINTIFMNDEDQHEILEFKPYGNKIQFIQDDWRNLNGKHLGAAVVRQLDKLTETSMKIKPGFISIIIPVLNEVATVKQTLNYLIQHLSKLDYGYEILIVDGGSQDGSIEVINDMKIEEIFLLDSKYKGRGGACRTGIEKSKGDVIGIFPADLEYDVVGFIKCLKLNLNGQSSATIGIRVSKTRNLKHQIMNVYKNQKIMGLLSYWGGISVSTLTLTKLHRFFLDPLSGVKIFNKLDIENKIFKRNGLDFEIELLQFLTKNDIEILEIPIDYSPRNKKMGKKTTVLKGLKALWYVLYVRRN
jgi:2-phospho-L-lactate transferase/gluconeogenesis factor (CofD/UPF0052 family)